MPLYQVSDDTSKKLEAVAMALGVSYHDEALDILINTAYAVTACRGDDTKDRKEVDGFNKGRLLASIQQLDAK